MESLYAQYIQERENKCVYENDRGFVRYCFEQNETNKICYIEEIFVLKEFRKGGEAVKLADHVSIIAKEQGCSLLYGSVSSEVESASVSLKVLLGYGMELSHVSNEMIYFKKDL